ncbi:MAG: PRC-barrel domain-containing protein [Pseudomonadota bacterium]
MHRRVVRTQPRAPSARSTSQRLAARARRFACAFLCTLLLSTANADVSKASDWLGRAVVTAAGEPLGRIEDFAIDIEQSRIDFIVVSVGSFLIDDALIAVDPDALGPSADGEYLVLNSDDLTRARRFNADSWPGKADVLPVDEPADAPFIESESAPAARADSSSGRAVISDGRRQATFADGERRIEPVRRSQPPRSATGSPATEAGPALTTVGTEGVVDASELPLPSFETLDADDNGVLDRNEFGPYLGLSEDYSEIDIDASGRIDRFEFQVLEEARRRR